MRAKVFKSTGSWYKVLLENGKMTDVRLRGKFKLTDNKITNPIAVGDDVEVFFETSGEGVIQEILPRKNYVVRASPRKKGHHHIIASNVDQAILISSLKFPKTSMGFIDRFFVTLEAFRITGKIVFNKSDLLDVKELKQAHQLVDVYQKLGYQAVVTSLDERGATDISAWFEGKTTLLSGHSGTGKSTLINLICPEAIQQVSTISQYSDKGTHTTTFAEMFQIDRSTFVIDTPGIKELGLSEIESEELSHYFPEMRVYLGTCKYHNCLHLNEPGCRVTAALKSGEIAQSRYQSYQSMLETEDNRK